MKRVGIRLLFSLAFLFFLLLLVELVFYVLNLAADREGPREYRISNSYIAMDPALGYRPEPGSRVNAVLKWDGREIYSADYSFDRFGRRETGVGKSRAADRFIIFFGGSFAFGEGLDNIETLPAMAGFLMPGYESYNYAFHGYGTQQMLALLEHPSRDLRAEIPERNGIAVYLFTDYHLARVAGTMSVVTAWGAGMPYYVLDDEGRPVRKGNFFDDRGNALYNFLSHEQVSKYFKVDWPLIGEDEVMLACSMVAESDRRFRLRFPGSEFRAVIYPGSVFSEPLAACLEEKGVLYLDYSNLFDPAHEDMNLSVHDPHPTAKANLVLAQKLALDLAAIPIPAP